MSNVETWKKEFKEYVDGLYLQNDDYKGIMFFIDDVDHIIKEQPTVESAPQWIPCNKKLPKEEEEYLITCEDRYGDTFVKKTMYSPDAELWWDVPSSETVTAWMPSPEPYEVGKREL